MHAPPTEGTTPGDASAPGEAPAPEQTLAECVEQYQHQVELALAAAPAARDPAILNLLVLRDRIASLAHDGPASALDLQDRITSSDGGLRRLLRSAPTSLRRRQEHMRALIDAPATRWWWHPVRPNALYTVLALFFLTVSLSLFADFTRRLLNSDPDEIGILSIAVQALAAVGASSTFTASGRHWLNQLSSRWRIFRGRPEIASLVASGLLLVLVFTAWRTLPAGLAVYYNNAAYHLLQPPGSRVATTLPPTPPPAESPPITQEAERLYQRAISLNPQLAQTHVNLGALHESVYDYSTAATDYRAAITIDSLHFVAYSDLARVLILNQSPYTALRVMDDAFAHRQAGDSLDPQLESSMYRNRAWAEYELGFYADAEGDVLTAVRIQPSAAENYCVLAKVDTKLEKSDSARRAWSSFEATYPKSSQSAAPIEPDCKRLAEESSHGNN